MQINKVSNNTVSFSGWGIRTFMPAKVRTERVQSMVDDACWRYGNIIGLKTSAMRELTQSADEIKMQFLKSLVTNYNVRNFTRKWNLKEEPDGLVEAFKAVEAPTMAHFNIVKHTDAPLGTLSKLFRAATDKESLEFVQKMQHEVLGGKKEAMKIITDMLTSENKQAYMKNNGEYLSYLKINKENGNAIKELDKMIADGTYDKKNFDAKIAIKTLMKNKVLKQNLGENTKYLEQHYSPAGEMFIKSIFSDYLAHKKGLTPDDFSEILKMYKTSTSENINTRLDVLNKFKYATAKRSPDAARSEIKSMKKLFDRMDSDKSSAKFVVKVLDDDIKAKSIKDIAGVLDVVPSEKAEIFHKNISRIVRFTDEEERIEALKKEVENPFFITEKSAKALEDSINSGFVKKESAIGKMVRFIENKYNIMKYHRIEGVQTAITTEVPEFVPVISTASVQTSTPVVMFRRTFKESPQARKLRVKNDVSEVIKQKLGAKTLERQQEAYKNGALVMRLKLLPEIFDSIKETRKIQKLSGLSPNVENADAIRLYSRINGKNRKLVNYMLKQTNSQGERIYNVKDILNELNRVEQKINNLKITKGKDFRAQDAKKVCELEYEIITSQYGKLRQARKTA